jgi:hypothetical protein
VLDRQEGLESCQVDVGCRGGNSRQAFSYVQGRAMPNIVASAFGRWGLGPGVREIYGDLLESWPNRS